MKTYQLHLFIFLLLGLPLAACSGGAVVFAPSPLPPELRPEQYQHPSATFSLILPPNWSIYERNYTSLAATTFSPPDSDLPLLTISVIDLGEPIAANDLGNLMYQYQTQYRPDLDQYTEQDRQALGDGSWRLTGLRQIPGGRTQQINTFVQVSGSLLSIMELTVPTNPTWASQIQTIINTFQLHPENRLETASLSLLSSSGTVALELVNISTWTDAGGIFFIAGEVANRGADPASGTRIQATLQTADGQNIIQALDFVMGYHIPAGGFAPFSLRFGTGYPSNATQYKLEILADPLAEKLAIKESEAFEWTDSLATLGSGQKVIVGDITNQSGQDLFSAIALATVFDETGQVIGTGFTPISPEVWADQRQTEFVIPLPSLGGEAASYIVNVQALAQLPK